MPVSPTHSISTAIMGAGFAKCPHALRWTVIEHILWAWILTIPAAGGAAYGLLRLFEAFSWTSLSRGEVAKFGRHDCILTNF
ncbi:inorganic phosphate transporter [Sinorhizobium fredii]